MVGIINGKIEITPLISAIKGTSKIKNNIGKYSGGTGALLIYNRWFLLQKILKNKLVRRVRQERMSEMQGRLCNG